MPSIPSRVPDRLVLPATPRTWRLDRPKREEGRAPVRKLFSTLRI